MVLHDAIGGANDTIAISVEIQNTDPFVGFQFDIPLPDQINYINNSAELSDRAVDHQIINVIINPNILRIFAYSTTQAEFAGNSGEICSFKVKLGAVPSDYNMNLQDAIIGNDQSQNIITGTDDGIVTIQAPDITINPTTLDYDRVPLMETSNRSFNITNNGNTNLKIMRIYTTHPDFEIVGDTTYTIPPKNSQPVTIRFHSNTKGTYNEQVIILSDDPDEAGKTVNLHVIAYAVNELDINNMFGRSGHPATMTIDISNMEEFVGFSLDLNIPAVMSYIPNSVALTSRATDHTVTAGMLNNGNVRVVSYSLTNSPFLGSDGDVVTLNFMIYGQGGFYNISFLNPVIGDINGENIISDHYSGTLEIAAPDIEVNSSVINFGVVSFLDTLTKYLTIKNHGSDTLIINNIIFMDINFTTTATPPLIILPNEQLQIPISFHSEFEGGYQTSLRLRSNDPDENSVDIQLSAQVFIPNIMRVDSTSIMLNDTGWVSISIENHEPFVGFQFDLIIPDGLYYANEVQLTDRAVDHSVVAYLVGPNKLTVFSYSMTQAEFSGTNGAVIKVKIEAGGESGFYLFELENVIIGNAQSENIVSSYESNTVSILGLADISLDQGWNLISWDVNTENDSVEYLLSNILDEVVVTLGFDGTGLTYDPNLPEFSTLQTMDHLHGYWIKATESEQLQLVGTHVYKDTPIQLNAGWNLVSYLPDEADSITHALNSIMDKITVVLGFDQMGLTFDPLWPQFSNLKILSPEHGYWIKTTESCVLIYPTSSMIESNNLEKKFSQDDISGVIPTSEWISVFSSDASINHQPLTVGSVLIAKDPDEVICGKCQVKIPGQFGMMSIYRDDPYTTTDEGAEPGDTIKIYIDNKLITDSIVWQNFGDVININGAIIENKMPVDYLLLENYPNPFNASTTICFQLPQPGQVSLIIYDGLGNRIRTLGNNKIDSDYYSVIWDGKNEAGKPMPSGIYFCQLKTESYTKIKKMLLLR